MTVRKRLFGTNGIRGIPNEDLTTEFCSSIGKAIGTSLSGSTIAVGRDTRISGDSILSSVVGGITSTGKSVIDLGVLPTPALQYYCKKHGIYGVMITASHNPPQFNGIKCIDSDGTELSREDEERIENIFYDQDFKTVAWYAFGRVIPYISAIRDYIEGIISLIDAEKIRSAGFRVAFDAGNGASYSSTPLLLESLGCSITALNCNPDGRFTSRPSEPTERNLSQLKALVKAGGFDIGIAHDGDADRAVFFTEEGEFIDGDISLSLLVDSIIKSGDVVVTPISSSDTISRVCEKKGAKLIRTRVGAPIVSREMISRRARIGGEENGGIIFSDHQYCRDGAMAAALFLNLMAKTGKRPSELISSLDAYHLHRITVQLTRKWEDVESRFQEEVSGMDIDRTDGFKIFLNDGWVLVRPSGTEPIVRIYGHSKKASRAREIAEKFRDIIDRLQNHNAR